MKDADTTGRRWVGWGAVLVGWTLIGLFFIGRNSIMFAGKGMAVPWARTFSFELTYWYLWALLTPLILWLARRLPVDRGRWRRGVLSHLLLGLLIAPLHAALDYGVSWLLAVYALRLPAEQMAKIFYNVKTGIMIASFNNSLTYWLLVGAYHTLDYYRKYRERDFEASQLEVRLAQAELQNLKMQLQPHFLFNTLHAISVLMREDVAAANRMLIRLGDLLRTTLQNLGTHEVSLRQEVEFLQSYLEIEQTRFQDRLTVRIDVEPSAWEARVPNLLLQPLVENAIRHGIAPMAAPGLIEIQARRERDTLRLQVRDNGPGIRKEELGSLMKGVGLTNTRARLEQLYGFAHRFELRNAPGGGLLVIIGIPFRQAEGPPDGPGR